MEPSKNIFDNLDDDDDLQEGGDSSGGTLRAEARAETKSIANAKGRSLSPGIRAAAAAARTTRAAMRSRVNQEAESLRQQHASDAGPSSTRSAQGPTYGDLNKSPTSSRKSYAEAAQPYARPSPSPDQTRASNRVRFGATEPEGEEKDDINFNLPKALPDDPVDANDWGTEDDDESADGTQDGDNVLQQEVTHSGAGGIGISNVNDASMPIAVKSENVDVSVQGLLRPRSGEGPNTTPPPAAKRSRTPSPSGEIPPAVAPKSAGLQQPELDFVMDYDNPEEIYRHRSPQGVDALGARTTLEFGGGARSERAMHEDRELDRKIRERQRIDNRMVHDEKERQHWNRSRMVDGLQSQIAAVTHQADALAKLIPPGIPETPEDADQYERIRIEESQLRDRASTLDDLLSTTLRHEADQLARHDQALRNSLATKEEEDARRAKIEASYRKEMQSHSLRTTRNKFCHDRFSANKLQAKKFLDYQQAVDKASSFNEQHGPFHEDQLQGSLDYSGDPLHLHELQRARELYRDVKAAKSASDRAAARVATIDTPENMKLYEIEVSPRKQLEAAELAEFQKRMEEETESRYRGSMATTIPNASTATTTHMSGYEDVTRGNPTQGGRQYQAATQQHLLPPREGEDFMGYTTNTRPYGMPAAAADTPRG